MKRLFVGCTLFLVLGSVGHAQEQDSPPPPPPQQPAEQSTPRSSTNYARPSFYFGAEGVGTFVLNQTGSQPFLQHGGGFNLFLGGRMGRWTGLELGWQPTFHSNALSIFSHPVSTVGLQAVTLDLKIFLLGGRFQPYFDAGIGAYILGDPFSYLSIGPGYQIGGGLDIWLLSFLSVGARALYRGAAIINYTGSENTYISMLTVALNLTIHL